jgi:hypothetical protein
MNRQSPSHGRHPYFQGWGDVCPRLVCFEADLYFIAFAALAGLPVWNHFLAASHDRHQAEQTFVVARDHAA